MPASSSLRTERRSGGALLRRAVQAVPLLAAGWLLSKVAAVAVTPIASLYPIPWRIDALTLVVLVGLCLGAGLPALQGAAQNAESPWETLRTLAALGLIAVGTLFEHLLILPAALLVASLLLMSWRWAVAALALFTATALLRSLGGITWQGGTTAAAAGPGVFLLILAAGCVGLPAFPAALVTEQPSLPRLRLQPIWLLPLLRTFEWGPWNTGWSVAVTLLGAATVLWGAAAALWSADNADRVAHLAQTWLGAALLAVGLATPVGSAAALLTMLGYGLGLALLQPAALERDRWALWAGPFPPALGFVAFWLTQGAAAASGSFLLAALLWLAMLLTGLAALRLVATSALPGRAATIGLTGLSCLLGVLSPLVLRLLIVPATELLQGGLTPYGLLDIWPWIGIAALDAGQRRVAVLPSIAVAVLALVIAALCWLLARLLGWLGSDAADAAEGWSWSELRERVWWARGRRRG